MSFIWVTDVKTQAKIAINPDHVVAVFTATEGEVEGKTVIGLVNGNVVVEEKDIDVISYIGG